MRQVRTLTLCLLALALAVFALGTVLAGTASAKEALPVWGKCEPTTNSTGGHFGNAGCTAIVKPLHKTEYLGGFEWYPLPEHSNAKLAYPDREGGSEIEQPVKTMTLNLASGQKITCGPDELETEMPLTGASVTKIAPYFASRENTCFDEESQECRSTDGSGAGEITISKSAYEAGIFGEPGSWTGTTRFLEGKNTSTPKVGIVYKTEQALQHFLAQIVCEGAISAINVGGDKKNEALTFGITPLNTMTRSYTATLTESGGVQLPASVKGEKIVPLKAQVNGGEWQTIGIEASVLLPLAGGNGAGSPRAVSESGLELKATP